MNDVLKQIDLCINKIIFLHEENEKVAVELKKIGKIRKLDVNLTENQIFNEENSIIKEILNNNTEILYNNEQIIIDLKAFFKKSSVKNYIAVILCAYAKEFYTAWKFSKKRCNDFNRKILSNINTMFKGRSNNADVILDEYFSVTKELINHRKENPNSVYASSICNSWLFYLIPIFNLYAESSKNIDVKITREILDILQKVRNMVSNGEYISSKIIRELDSRCADKAFVYDMVDEYNDLIKKLKKYRLSLICKEEKNDVVNIEKTSTLKQPKIPTEVSVITREERIKLYEAKKNKHHPYIDEESTLTSDEIEYVCAYVDMVLEESASNSFNIDKIIDDIPVEEFNSEINMLNEIISRLKLNNFNSNTNKVLIKLNARLNEIVVKKMNRKNKNS